MKIGSVEGEVSGLETGSHYKTLFVVGSPRSGTTWLQLLLSQHPAVVSGPETQLWAQYFVHLANRWREEQRKAAEGLKVSGLTQVVSEEEFFELCRAFARGVFEIVRRSNPAASVVLEKSPSHAEHAELILRLFPDAFFLHILRDPRGVAASFRHAGKTWWREAPTGAIAATERWRRTVRAGRAIAALTEHYREVRYEDLLDDGPPQLESIFRWLDLPADRAFCLKALEDCRIEKLREGSTQAHSAWSLDREPEGFFRRGTAAGWLEDLSANDVALVERVAGDLMREVGYASVSVGRRTTPRLLLFRVVRALRGALKRAVAGVDWRLRDLLKRL